MIKVIVKLNGDEKTINGDGQNIKGTITQEVGAINSFEFEIYPQNIGFDLIQSRKTLVKAINTVTGRVEFAGRVLLAEQKMESNGVISKRVTCESYLGYLYDSVQPFAEMATMPLRDFLQLVIDNHNACVESSKQMQLGTVNVDVAGTGNVTKGLQYGTTYDTIKSKLVDIYGGELEVVENEGVLILNYVKQIGETRATTIELGRNMQAASRQVSPLEIITRVIPLGAKIKRKETDAEGGETEVETDERLTLVGYSPEAGAPAFTVPWIDDEEKQKDCGIVCGVLDFSDVTLQSNLYRKAIEYMTNESLVSLSHTLTALDLKEIGQAIDGLNCGDSYPVKNKLIGLDEVLRITKKTIDINAPYKSSITIGEKRATLSSIQAGTSATIGGLYETVQTINKTANDLKEHVSSNIENLKSRTVTLETSVTNNSEKIESFAGKTYVESSNFETYKESVNSQFTQTATDISAKFTKTTERITEVDGDLQSKYEKILKNISLNENGVSVGGGTKQILLTVDNENGIIFSRNGVPFGWWDGVDFHTGNVVIAVNERAQFGDFAFIPRSSGALSFLKVGGNAGAAHTHDYKEIVIVEPTCTETGVKTTLCTSCGDSSTETIPALGHNYNEVVTPPTPTEQGYTTHTCVNCGDSYIDSYTEPTNASTLILLTNASDSASYGDEVYFSSNRNGTDNLGAEIDCPAGYTDDIYVMAKSGAGRKVEKVELYADGMFITSSELNISGLLTLGTTGYVSGRSVLEHKFYFTTA